jgi:hypothetical protein
LAEGFTRHTYKKNIAMSNVAKSFQVRHQTLVFLAQVVQMGEHGAQFIAQVDALADELENAWEVGDLEQLQAVCDKAKALADLARGS